MQTFRLFRVCVPERLWGGFEEVLVVAHLGYWHTVELVWTKEREIYKHKWKVLHLFSLKETCDSDGKHSFLLTFGVFTSFLGVVTGTAHL